MFRPEFYRAMTPAAGALLACIGACLLVGAFQPNPVRLALMTTGLLAGVWAMAGTGILTRLRGLERPSSAEVTLAWPPVLAGIGILWLLLGVLPPGERALWLAGLGVTALHLFPLYWSLGPAVVVLGGLCLANTLTGLAFAEYPLEAAIAGNGALMLVIGLMMFAGAFRRRAVTA